MSVVEFHDLVKYDLDAKIIAKRLSKQVGDDGMEKLVHDAKGRQTYVSDIRKQAIIKNRVKNLMSLDHCIFDKRNFGETWVFNFKANTEAKPEDELFFNAFHLDPSKVTGFQNYKDLNDFFQVTKISVYFTSNAASNFAPINVVYIPPGIATEDITPSMCLQANKVATYSGKETGYMSIILPKCLMKHGDYVNPHCYSGLYSLKTEGTEYDYGTLVFYSQNYEQSVNFDMYWDIDYYACIDYLNLPVDDGEGDGECDDHDQDMKVKAAPKKIESKATLLKVAPKKK